MPPPAYGPVDVERRDEELQRRAKLQLDGVLAEVSREMPEDADVRVEQEVVVGHAARCWWRQLPRRSFS